MLEQWCTICHSNAKQFDVWDFRFFYRQFNSVFCSFSISQYSLSSYSIVSMSLFQMRFTSLFLASVMRQQMWIFVLFFYRLTWNEMAIRLILSLFLFFKKTNFDSTMTKFHLLFQCMEIQFHDRFNVECFIAHIIGRLSHPHWVWIYGYFAIIFILKW